MVRRLAPHLGLDPGAVPLRVHDADQAGPLGGARAAAGADGLIMRPSALADPDLALFAHELAHLAQHRNRATAAVTRGSAPAAPGRRPSVTEAEAEAAALADAARHGIPLWHPRAVLPDGHLARDSGSTGVMPARPADAGPGNTPDPGFPSLQPAVATGQTAATLSVLTDVVRRTHSAELDRIKAEMSTFGEIAPDKRDYALSLLDQVPFVVAKAMVSTLESDQRQRLAQLSDRDHQRHPAAAVAVLAALSTGEIDALGDKLVTGRSAALHGLQFGRLEPTALRALYGFLRTLSSSQLLHLTDGDRRDYFRQHLAIAPPEGSDQDALQSALASESEQADSDPLQASVGATHPMGTSSSHGAMTPDPPGQPIYAAQEDRLAAARREIRDRYAFMLEAVPPVWGDDPGMVIKWATSALATLRTGQTSQGEPLTRAERIYLSRGLARAFAALMDLEQTAERAEDGALVYHEDGQTLPWTKERPHSVADLPPFTPGPQAVWRSLAGQDPEADQVAPTVRSASRGEKDPPSGSPEGRRQTAPKLAHTISFKPPEEIDATTDEGKLGILALVVKAMYPSIDNLLLQWVVLKLGPTLPNGDPRFDSAKLREFNEKKEENKKKKKENKKEGNKPEEDEKISITTDEKFTSELDLVLLQAPNRYGLIGAEVYRGSSGMYYIVGAEFGAFLVAITGGAGLGLLASGGGTVVAEGTAIGLETAAPSFGEIVGEASLRLGVSAQAAWAQAAPWVTAITASTTAGYGIQAAFEGRFGEWSFETMNDLAEQHFLFHASGLHYTPSEPEVQGAPPEPTAPAAAGIAAEEIQLPPAAAETIHEPPTPPPGAAATTEQVASPPSAPAATTEQTTPVATEPTVEMAKPTRPSELRRKAEAAQGMVGRAERGLQKAVKADQAAGERVATAEDRVRRVQSDVETRQQAGKGLTKAQQSKLESARNKLAKAETKQAAGKADLDAARTRVEATKQLAETRAAAYEEAKADAAQRAANRTVQERLEKLWNDARRAIWKKLAQAQIEARKAGTSSPPLTQAEYDEQLAAEAQNAQLPIDENQWIDWPDKTEGARRLPPGAVQELNPIKGMTDAELADLARTGKLPPRWKGVAELEHSRIPQRVGNWLAKAGVPLEEAAALTKRTELSNLDPASSRWHATVDEYRAQFSEGYDPQDPMSSLDTRVQHPLEGLRDDELADILATVKKYGANLDLPVMLGTRKVTLGDVLRDEMATRPAFKGNAQTTALSGTQGPTTPAPVASPELVVPSVPAMEVPSSSAVDAPPSATTGLARPGSLGAMSRLSPDFTNVTPSPPPVLNRIPPPDPVLKDPAPPANPATGPNVTPSPPPVMKPPAPKSEPAGKTSDTGVGAPPKQKSPPASADAPEKPVTEEPKKTAGFTSQKNPAIDSKRQLQAKTRVEQTKTELQTASREKASAEQKLLSAQARVRAVTDHLRTVPQHLQSESKAILRESDLDERLQLVNEIRASRDDWSPEEKGWLDQQAELLDAQLDVEAAQFGQKKQGANVRDSTILVPARQQELARASKSVADLIRSEGPNYRTVKKVNYDEVMGKKAWDEFTASRAKDAPALALNPDHIISVREIRDEVVKSGLLELYDKASPAIKEQIEKAIQDLGDERRNLVAMEEFANKTLKSDRSWWDIPYEKVAKLYTLERFESIRTRETEQREHFQQVIQALVTRFSK
jgi:hypothetical protein